jgi:segregation and condensation protein B
VSEDKAPISWDAVAAELASTREEAERRGDADPGAWDAVAAELAARVAERPVEPPLAVPVPAEDDDVPAGEISETGEPEAAEAEETEGAEAEAPVELAEEPPALFPAPPAEEEFAEIDPVELRGGLEALLFVVEGPVDEETLAASLRCPVAQVDAGLRELAAEYDERRAGLTLRQVGEGWRLYTREDHAAVVERYLGEGQRNRLTQAALETLAVIAYRQPVTRARISAIRGVGVDGVMRTLLSRGLVHETSCRTWRRCCPRPPPSSTNTPTPDRTFSTEVRPWMGGGRCSER